MFCMVYCKKDEVLVSPFVEELIDLSCTLLHKIYLEFYGASIANGLIHTSFSSPSLSYSHVPKRLCHLY